MLDLDRPTGVRETYRRSLVNYPTLYNCPLDVSLHLLAGIGTGYEWDVNGDLSCYLNIPEKEDPTPKLYESEFSDPCLKDLHNTFRLQSEAQLLKYKFILENMEVILRSRVDTDLFDRHNVRYDSRATSISPKYAPVFNFPDNISLDWAEAVEDFLNWWLVNLNHVNGIGSRGEIDFWSEDQKEYRQVMLDARKRIHPIVHNGQTKEESDRIVRELVDQILAEERR